MYKMPLPAQMPHTPDIDTIQAAAQKPDKMENQTKHARQETTVIFPNHNTPDLDMKLLNQYFFLLPKHPKTIGCETIELTSLLVRVS